MRGRVRVNTRLGLQRARSLDGIQSGEHHGISASSFPWPEYAGRFRFLLLLGLALRPRLAAPARGQLDRW